MIGDFWCPCHIPSAHLWFQPQFWQKVPWIAGQFSAFLPQELRWKCRSPLSPWSSRLRNPQPMAAWEPREKCLGLPKDNPGDIPYASQNTSIIKLPLPTTATMIMHPHIGFFSFLPFYSTPTLTLLRFISQTNYLHLRYSLRPVLGGSPK